MFDLSIQVLIVDDMGTMRKLVTKACKGVGFTNFTEAADGALAWDALTNAPAPIGLIISDWNMPNCTGIDFLRRVRADGRYKHLPFLLVTAESEASQVVEAVKAGVSGYIVKPFSAETLAEKLEQVHKKMVG